jgi:serine O-acetyltransferase
MANFKINISRENLSEYVSRQLEFYFPDGIKNKKIIYKQLVEVLDRVEQCFTKINLKYYLQNKTAHFDYLNTDHYAVLLYLLSHLLWKNGCDIKLRKKFIT